MGKSAIPWERPAPPDSIIAQPRIDPQDAGLAGPDETCFAQKQTPLFRLNPGSKHACPRWLYSVVSPTVTSLQPLYSDLRDRAGLMAQGSQAQQALGPAQGGLLGSQDLRFNLTWKDVVSLTAPASLEDQDGSNRSQLRGHPSPLTHMPIPRLPRVSGQMTQ